MPDLVETVPLVGIGIYTAAEAGRLAGVPAQRVRRWLAGHTIGERAYRPLWRPQIDLGDGGTFLGFRDLTEVRVVDALIRAGLSAQRVRRAIEVARERYGFQRPLSTQRFRTDGATVWLLLSEEDGGAMVDLLRDQYAIRKILEPSFKGLEFDGRGEPTRWRIAPGIVLDPDHAFGEPVDRESLVPTRVLAAAAIAEGSVDAAARAYAVAVGSVARAVDFEASLRPRKAA